MIAIFYTKLLIQYTELTSFHIKYIFLKFSLYISGFWSGELLRRARGLQTFPGCAEPGPALRHLCAHGKQAFWPTGQRETLVKERAIAFGKKGHFYGVIH